MSAPRTSVLAIASLVIAVLFLPLGLGAFFTAGCTRGCEAEGGPIYVRPGEELPREVSPLATRVAAIGAALPELGALLLATSARRRIRKSAGRLGGSDVAAVAFAIALFSLLLFVPVFACGARLFAA